MAASKYDFGIEQGASYKLTIRYKDNEDNVIPLVNYCARLSWKTNTGETQSLYSIDPANNNYKFYIDEPNGLIYIMFSANFTNSFSFATAKYDLELKSPDDLYAEGGKYTIRLLYGTINIIKRFSQNTNLMDCAT